MLLRDVAAAPAHPPGRCAGARVSAAAVRRLRARGNILLLFLLVASSSGGLKGVLGGGVLRASPPR